MAKAKKSTPPSKTKKKAAAKKPAVPIKKVASQKSDTKKSAVKKSGAKQPPVKKMTLAPSPQIAPLDERIVVELSVAKEKTTPGGIIIPDTATFAESYRTGIVRSLGRGHQNKKGMIRTIEVQIGEEVTFPAYAGTEVEWDGQKLVIIKESELLGVSSSKK